ncbi:MAG: LemA family protein, partial [Muribaculaceae bacterium]|nr:LemA family protein [Muribaculaceae bacterium]
EAQYQRRADLVENLVNTVKGYAKHERETFEAVTNARTSVGSIKIDNIDDLDPEKLQQFQKAQSELGGALKSLIAVSENYPDLKASEEFTKLQDQLESTENRIAMVREDFNKAAKDYNTKIKSFPKNIFAGIFGFKEKPYFKSEEGSEKAPKVSFE